MESLARPSECDALPPERWASWRLAALGLTTLYSLETAYAVFWMWPLRSADSWDMRWFVRAAAAGAVLSLPVLVATLGVVVPGRAGVRLLVSSSLAVLSSYALIVGTWHGHAIGSRGAQLHEAASMLIAYLVFLLPAFAIKRARGWTIVPAAPEGQLRQRQFSVAGVMLATACVATVFGLGRWVLPLAQWPNPGGVWGNLALGMIILGGMIAWSCLPLLPLTALVLGVRRRVYTLIATLATVAVVFSGLYLVLQQVNGVRGIQYFAALLFGAYLSAFVYLLVIRACGFRLVRGTAASLPQ